MSLPPYPTIRQMQYLDALARHGNFQKAADSCAVTQPSLSAGIAEMEMLLGAKLIDRTTRKKVIFTPFGEDVLARGQKILQDMERLSARARQLAKPLTGPMRVGMIPTIAPYLLPDILKPLQKKFPEMEFQIFEDMSAGLVDGLRGARIDIALMAFPYDAPGLRQINLFNEEFVCAAPPGMFGKAATMDVGELKDKKLLLLEDGHCLRDHALSACYLQKPGDQRTFSAASLATLIQLAADGYGATLLPAMAVKGAALPAPLRLIRFKAPAPRRTIGLLTRPSDPREADIAAVCGHIQTVLKRAGKR